MANGTTTTIEEQLRAEVNKINTDSQIFHNVVHGLSSAVIQTENGPVKTIANLIENIRVVGEAERANLIQNFNLALQEDLENIRKNATEIDRLFNEYREIEAALKPLVISAEGASQEAVAAANALNLPQNLEGKEGFLLQVNETATGYTVNRTNSVVHGLKRVGEKLVDDIDVSTIYREEDYTIIVSSFPGSFFSINENGHLLLTF